MLNVASLLLEDGSHASTVFLAIKALEETAKIHIGMYRNADDAAPRRKDPLFRHDKKHCIAASPTIAMGSRLKEAVGEKRMHELIKIARNGQLKVEVFDDAFVGYTSHSLEQSKITDHIFNKWQNA